MEIHISVAPETLFMVGPVHVTNSLLTMFIVMGILLIGAVGLWRTPDEGVASGTSGRARQQRARVEAAQRDGLRIVTMWASVATAGLFSLLLVAGAMASGPGAEQTGDELAPPQQALRRGPQVKRWIIAGVVAGAADLGKADEVLAENASG